MGDATPAVLSVRGLSVRFLMPGGREVAAVNDVTFDLAPGECLALVGESGCGKSVLTSALLGLLPANARTRGTAHLRGPAGVPSGSVLSGSDVSGNVLSGNVLSGSDVSGSDGVELLRASDEVLARRVRGRLVGLVPQSPAAHLTPVRTVRSHLEETVRELTDTARAGLRKAAEAAAARAAFPADHLDRYPHQLSGGLAQRAATALALVADAPLLIADEPTTGLDRDLVDRTVAELRRHADAGHALLVITHDLGAAERIADRVAVMYAGRVVEVAPARRFFGTPGPRHPYARGLLEALPERSFAPIPGLPPELDALPAGCAFAARCHLATERCATQPVLSDGVACHHAPEPADA